MPVDRLRLIERQAGDGRGCASAGGRPVKYPRSLIGLIADEPDVIDEMCARAYEARSTAKMLVVDEWAVGRGRSPTKTSRRQLQA